MRNLFLSLAILTFCTAVQAELTKASIFAIGETTKSPLFTQETTKTVAGNTISWTSVIWDQTGTVVMKEQATIENGLVVTQEIDHLQINERYMLQLKDGRVTFLTYDISNGKMEETDKADRKAPKDFVMGPSTEIFLRRNIEEFKAKRSVERDFGVFELGRFINFKFLGIATVESKVEIKMRPANFFVSMLVEPMKIIFDTSAGKIIYFKGRTPLRQLKNGKWKPFDAEIIYH